jgi:peptidyl-tRNA hydrolase
MSTGKSAAQVAHAAVEAYKVSSTKMIDHWEYGKHYTKLVMLAEDADQLLVIERYLKERGFKTAIIIDEGRTEIKPYSYTALGIEIVDKDDPHVQASFEGFKTYKDLPRPVDLQITYNTVAAFGHLNRLGKKYRLNLPMKYDFEVKG